MTDDQGEQTPVTDTQESATPTEEQQTPENQVETPVQESENEKVVKHNKEYIDKLQQQLREERTRREYMEATFKSLQPKKEEKKQITFSPVYDPETGLINDSALSERDRILLDTQERLARAEEALTSKAQLDAQREVDKENEEMYQSFPELVPESKEFSQELHALTRAIYLDAMTNPQDYGKQLRGVEAAKRAKFILNKNAEQAKREGAQEALEQLSPKEQAALEATGSSGRRTQIQNLDNLRLRTRKNDIEALVERLTPPKK